MLRIISLIIIIASAIVLGMYAFGMFDPPAKSPRELLESNVAQAKLSKQLSTEEEILLRLQLSISSYTLNNFGPPTSLAELVPDYFDEIPHNPRTNEPFEYRLVDGRPAIGGQIQLALMRKNKKKATTTPESTDTIETYFEGPDLDLEDVIIDSFLYNPEGKRDPFSPIGWGVKAEKIDPNAPPLERYSLGQLRVTAVLQDSKGKPIALVEDSAGTGFTIRQGTKIGNKKGVVALITKEVVRVVESKKDVAGKETKTVVELAIQPKTPNILKDKGVISRPNVAPKTSETEKIYNKLKIKRY